MKGKRFVSISRHNCTRLNRISSSVPNIMPTAEAQTCYSLTEGVYLGRSRQRRNRIPLLAQWIAVGIVFVVSIAPTFISYRPYRFTFDEAGYLQQSINHGKQRILARKCPPVGPVARGSFCDGWHTSSCDDGFGIALGSSQVVGCCWQLLSDAGLLRFYPCAERSPSSSFFPASA